MKKSIKGLVIAFSVVIIFALAASGFFVFVKWEYHLPSERYAKGYFGVHKNEFIRFAELIEKDPSVRYIGSDGVVDIDGTHGRFVSKYRDFAHALKLKNVIVREDGSIEFAVWGYGGPIISDSYMGVRYYPNDRKVGVRPGWSQTVVTSLDSEKLPQENGMVATGLYVVEVEPEWFIYRFEYQE